MAMSFLDLDWPLISTHLIQLMIAYLLALPIAWDRERETRSSGLRTFPLVAVGSCGYILTSLSIFSGGDSESHARILYGLMTGIGFIGGGAILKEKGQVSGTATAASIWITGAVGAATAWNRYEIAILLSLMNFFSLRIGRQIKVISEDPPIETKRIVTETHPLSEKLSDQTPRQ
ncbi:MgtC/SapB family protein [Motiliproteus sp. MSK22-1]|uniref:MgtC/SapB family protein n=1 Tax=Motiliproteus sp. MSK22-1 TaxID=1897630 RepID=UPI00097784CC|nr:MgtC/SapB family protein [Motiliproteus sp. MSK22-1]OMH33629.1 magnesium transporter MgtC [Motiliproteus sp. MSK22-1]